MSIEKLIERIFNENIKKYLLLFIYNILAAIFYIIFINIIYRFLSKIFNFLTNKIYIDYLYDFLHWFNNEFIIYNWKIILFIILFLIINFIFKFQLFVLFNYREKSYIFPVIYYKIKNILFILFGIFSLTSLGIFASFSVYKFILWYSEMWFLTNFLFKIHNILWESFFFFLHFYYWEHYFYVHIILSILAVFYILYFVKLIN